MTSHPETTDPVARPLSRVLGLVFGLAVVVGGVIGSGIMRAPGVIALGLHSPWIILLAWVLGGGAAMLASMPLVEAGASVPMAGGTYPIARRAFGPAVGLATGWLSWLQYVASNAFISVVFGEYVHRLGLAGGVSTGVLACGLIVFVAALNLLGTRVTGASQGVASALKGGVFVVLVVILFLSPRAPDVAARTPLSHAAGIAAIVMAIRVIYQTYAGWDGAIYFSEEVERPERNVARATFWGIGLVTILYVLVNAAVLHVLPVNAIAGSDLAVGDAAKVTLGAVGDKVVTLVGLLSLAAIVNLQVMASPRIIWRMAKDGLLPSVIARVGANGAPWVSVILVVLASFVLAATGSYETIVTIYAPWSIGAILMVCLSSIKLRVSEPDLPRPWKMPLFPWIAIGASLVQAALIAVVVWDDPKSGLASAVVAAAPIPIYFVLKALRKGARP
jgi:APA family basic amino acid/polyamine antiporter